MRMAVHPGRPVAQFLCAMATLLVAISIGACGSSTNPSGPSGSSGAPIALSANVVVPDSVDAVSDFHSCSGHAFPETNSPNSAKNYFWPNSTNFSTNGQLPEFAACTGTTGQNSDDTNANEQDRGQTIHLYCTGSATAVRYFHVIVAAGIGQHVQSGDLIGHVSMLGTGQAASANRQNSSNFDIAVSATGDDNVTENYFSALDAPTFAAWASRGLTSPAQTINQSNPTCSSFLSIVGSPDVFSFTPVR